MVSRKRIRGANKGTRTLNKGLGATSFNFIAPIPWRIFDTLWLELNTGRDLCWGAHDNMAFVLRAIYE
ncbi:hypothetical protein DITRI_Ditri12bG0145000 [Diplodiscus trichospermus]